MTGSVGTTQMATTNVEIDAALPRHGLEAAITEFIRKNGITRCPTACVLPTQGEVPESDRAALSAYATDRERSRQAKAAQRARPFGPAAPRGADIG
jgi:hypothetical protein